MFEGCDQQQEAAGRIAIEALTDEPMNPLCRLSAQVWSGPHRGQTGGGEVYDQGKEEKCERESGGRSSSGETARSNGGLNWGIGAAETEPAADRLFPTEGKSC